MKSMRRGPSQPSHRHLIFPPRASPLSFRQHRPKKPPSGYLLNVDFSGNDHFLKYLIGTMNPNAAAVLICNSMTLYFGLLMPACAFSFLSGTQKVVQLLIQNFKDVRVIKSLFEKKLLENKDVGRSEVFVPFRMIWKGKLVTLKLREFEDPLMGESFRRGILLDVEITIPKELHRIFVQNERKHFFMKLSSLRYVIPGLLSRAFFEETGIYISNLEIQFLSNKALTSIRTSALERSTMWKLLKEKNLENLKPVFRVILLEKEFKCEARIFSRRIPSKHNNPVLKAMFLLPGPLHNSLLIKKKKITSIRIGLKKEIGVEVESVLIDHDKPAAYSLIKDKASLILAGKINKERLGKAIPFTVKEGENNYLSYVNFVDKLPIGKEKVLRFLFEKKQGKKVVALKTQNLDLSGDRNRALSRGSLFLRFAKMKKSNVIWDSNERNDVNHKKEFHPKTILV